MPDQKHTFVTAGYGRFISTGPPATPTRARFADNNYVTAALTPDGTLGMAYLPQGGTIHRGHEQAPEWHHRPLV